LVVSRDGFILWARSSKRALRTGAYYKTAGRPPVSIHESSLAQRIRRGDDPVSIVTHEPGIWFREPCQEIALLSDYYDFALSLLHLPNDEPRFSDEEESIDDVADAMAKRTPGSSWLE
jgi:hypothetical protein